MLFHVFDSQEERRNFGGGDFIELQYCRGERSARTENLVSGNAISFWKDDSLYISGDDMEIFFNEYGKIFYGGIYANGESGHVDFCGINYYSPERSNLMMERIAKERPLDCLILLEWLKGAEEYNGFYVLGL